MKIVLGTGNQNKVRELSEMLGDAYEVVPGSNEVNPVESGSSCAANAVIKAIEYAKFESDDPNTLVVADDSGIFVPALGDNVPGIWSSRLWACEYDFNAKKLVNVKDEEAPEGFDRINNELLLELINKYVPEDRKAYFYSGIAVVKTNGEFINLLEGMVWGEVGDEIIEDSGWGYDHMFNGPGGHWGKILSEEKNKVSHRSVAANKLKNWLPDYLKVIKS